MAVQGINRAGVTIIQRKIKEYEQDVNKWKENMKANINSAQWANLMKGTNSVNTLKKYINQIGDDTEREIISYLDRLIREIDIVYSSYQHNDRAATAFTSKIRKS